MTVCACGNTVHRGTPGAFCDICAEAGRFAERTYSIVGTVSEGRDGLTLDGMEVSVYRDPDTGRIVVQIRATEVSEDFNDEDGGPVCDVVKVPRALPGPVQEPMHFVSGATFTTGGTVIEPGAFTTVEWTGVEGLARDVMERIIMRAPDLTEPFRLRRMGEP